MPRKTNLQTRRESLPFVAIEYFKRNLDRYGHQQGFVAVRAIYQRTTNDIIGKLRPFFYT
jgi:hypothetical protein